jgi:hypothetical protein
MTKKQKFALLSVASASAIALIGVSSFASNENGLLKANAAYSNSHTLTIDSGSSVKPTSTDAYTITDTSLGLHTGGYLWVQFSNVSGDVSFANTDDVFSASGTAGTSGYINFYVDIWANGVTSFTANFSYAGGDDITVFKSEVYADCKYPTVSSSSHAIIDFTSGVSRSLSLANTNMLELYFDIRSKTSSTAPSLKLTSLIVNFTC